MSTPDGPDTSPHGGANASADAGANAAGDAGSGTTGADFAIVGVGASAGGLEALREMLSGDEDVSGLAFVIVQHLDPNHESMMAQLIERYTRMPVRQIEGGERVARDHVYVIPPGFGLEIADGVLTLVAFDAPRGLRRPIDDFFESLAHDQGPMSACVILSGTGADGSRGLRAIKEMGGIALAQEPSDARYDGMPLAAAGTGLVDYVVPARGIIARLRGYFDRRDAAVHPDDEAVLVADHVDALCQTLRDSVGHDFSGYKRSTLARRIQRRMQVLGIEDGHRYLARARSDPDECQALFRDLLINVTRFFRDREAFERLQEDAIEPIVRATAEDDEVRIWVPGCSSGEEAYTIAMQVHAVMERIDHRPHVAIFASDIDDRMLQIAREGTYPVASLADIPEPYRSAYTAGRGEHFSIAPAIRDMVRFSNHSVLKDPPFSRIDLISCRNLLIYFDDKLQQSVMPLFHYALRPEAFLFLGPSETIGRFDDLFDVVDARSRLFRRRGVRTIYPLDLPVQARRPASKPARPRNPAEQSSWIEGDAMRQMVQRYAPPSLMIDGQGGLIASWGPVGRYFDFPGEQERRIHLPALAKPGLREVIGQLVRETVANGRRTIARDVRVRTDFGEQPVAAICEPVRDGTYLLVLREAGPFVPVEPDDMFEISAADEHTHVLEEELRATRHRLRSTVEELETANEELKSSNEEMMSMNEELQSTNEELTTVNDELKVKLDQLTVANSDLRNFFDSTQAAVIVVDAGLQIRSFTEPACALFPLRVTDRGRSLADVVSLLESEDYLDWARQVAAGAGVVEERVRQRDGSRDYSLRIMPYRRHDGTIDGATMVFTDITKFLELERDLAEERQRLELAIEVAGIGVWEYDPARTALMVNPAERALFTFGENDPADLSALVARVHPDDRDAVQAMFTGALAGGNTGDQTFRVAVEGEAIRWLHGLGQRVGGADAEARVVGVTYDITAERELLEQRELMLREMNHRVKNLFAVVAAMIRISRRDATTLEAFADDLVSRVDAMQRAHSLILDVAEGEAVPLADIVAMVLRPAQAGQPVVVEGPPVVVDPEKLTPLALILHEWATNAAKYGALSWAEGALAVRWSCRGDAVLLDWSETVPPGRTEGEAGFGTRLIAASVRQLGATLEGSLAEGRFHRRIVLPALAPVPA